MVGMPSAISVTSSTEGSPPKSRPLATASAKSSLMVMGSFTRVSCLASTLAASNMVSISASSSRPRRSISSKLSACSELTGSSCLTSSVNPRIAFRGLFRSWLTLAKNRPRIFAARSRAAMARSWARAKTRKRSAKRSIARPRASTSRYLAGRITRVPPLITASVPNRRIPRVAMARSFFSERPSRAPKRAARMIASRAAPAEPQESTPTVEPLKRTRAAPSSSGVVSSTMPFSSRTTW